MNHDLTQKLANEVVITSEMKITGLKLDGLMVTLSNDTNTHQVIVAQAGTDTEVMKSKKFNVVTTIKEII